MSDLLKHVYQLITFQHQGRGLDWDAKNAQQLVLVAFLMPLLIYTARHGAEALIHYLMANWMLGALGALATAWLLIHLQRVTILRVEVGVILICLTFYLMRLTLSLIMIESVKWAIYVTYLWQGMSLACFIVSSRIKVSIITRR